MITVENVDISEIRLGDILGEGQEVWMIVRMTDELFCVYWGPPGSCMLFNKPGPDNRLSGRRG